MFEMRESLLKPLIHLQIVKLAIHIWNNDGSGLSPLYHIFQFLLAQIGINRQGYEARPFTGNPGQKPIDAVGRLNNNTGELGDSHLHP